MKPKYKTTGCARFFIFFLIFIPAVFFGATYFRGENGLQMIRDFFHKIAGTSDSAKPDGDGKHDTYSSDDCKVQLKKLQDENDELKKEIREKENEIGRLKASAH